MKTLLILLGTTNGGIGGVVGYFYGVFSWQLWFMLMLSIYSIYAFSCGLEEMEGLLNGR